MTGPILDIQPESYERHAIHGEGRAWAETNCYVDVVVELLHAYGFEPIAALPFTLRIDFEGDQWTFFKFPAADLFRLYGLDLQEFNPWRDLVQHIEQQVRLSRPVLVELDSYFLPDTQGSAYQLEHVKTTIAVNSIDLEREHLGYFHAQGYYHLEGRDFRDIFQTGGLVHDRMMPPYVEYAHFRDVPVPRSADELIEASLVSLREQLALLPETNPFEPFKERFQVDLEWLMTEPLETFHQYSFASLRQYGACFELVQTYLEWLDAGGQAGLEPSIEAFKAISTTAKTFQFQLARALARKRALALDPIDAMAALWESGLGPIVERYG